MNFQAHIHRLPFIIQRKLTMRAMAGCISILEEAGCKPFLVYGTALAVLRNHTIRFSHDPDCDIGVMIENWNPVVKDLLLKQGYLLEHELGTFDFGYELSFRKFGVKIDLFMFYKAKGKVWNCLWDLPDAAGTRKPIFHTYPSSLFEERQWITIHHRSIPLLQQLEPYIKTVYGEDWRVPVTKWNWRTDHHCIDHTFTPS